MGKPFLCVWLCAIVSVAVLFAGDSVPEVPDTQPLYDSPETLKHLDPTDPIWVTSDRSALILVGKITLREGLLEFFACRVGSKEYESIMAIDVKPYLIHAGLLVIGAKKGHPVRYDPEFVPPAGEKIDILVRWRGEDGRIQEVPAGEMVRTTETGVPLSEPWVFTGSVSGKDKNGNPYYLANITGELISVTNFAATILDVPFESVSDYDNLVFEPNTEKIPPLGTEVTLVLTCAEKGPVKKD